MRTIVPGSAARRLAAVFVLAVSVPATSNGQASTPGRSALVQVRVVDSSGTPVAGAEVAVMRGLTVLAGRASTDSRGDASITISGTGAAADLLVRKIGYVRVDRFFNDSASSLRFDVVLPRAAQALDAVRVVAQNDLKRASYFIDANAIDASDRFLGNALDIVTKLRPYIVCGRDGLACAHSRTASASRNQRTLLGRADDASNIPFPETNIWVNGQWINSVAYVDLPAWMRLTAQQRTALGPAVAGVLASIKPEHVSEMHFLDDLDAPPDATPHSTPAIYITLKAGIAFEPGEGSYVVGEIPSGRLRKAASGSSARLLGVFDDSTGEALEGVAVIDVATGTKATTTSTGTVSLGFLAVGDQQVRIERDGYAPQDIAVQIAAENTVPITVTLVRRPKAL